MGYGRGVDLRIAGHRVKVFVCVSFFFLECGLLHLLIFCTFFSFFFLHNFVSNKRFHLTIHIQKKPSKKKDE